MTSYSGRTVSNNSSAPKSKSHWRKETFLGKAFFRCFVEAVVKVLGVVLEGTSDLMVVVVLLLPVGDMFGVVAKLFVAVVKVLEVEVVTVIGGMVDVEEEEVDDELATSAVEADDLKLTDGSPSDLFSVVSLDKSILLSPSITSLTSFSLFSNFKME